MRVSLRVLGLVCVRENESVGELVSLTHIRTHRHTHTHTMASSKQSSSSRSHPKFSIEDAFEEDADDAIRLYGATSERSPLKPKARGTGAPPEDMAVRIEDPLAGSGVKGLLTVPDLDVRR